MATCMLCADFECGCHILPQTTIYSINGRAKAFQTAKFPELENAVNAFILIGKKNDGLLGQSCFDSLCAAIKTAENTAIEYRENNDYEQGDPLAEFWAYLPEKWKKLLRNSHFQNMYASYIVFYYYNLGYADAETTLSGDIKNDIKATDVNNFAGKNIEKADGSKNAANVHSIAQGYYDAFINNFWKSNKSLYGCGTCDNECDTHCNDVCTCYAGNCKLHSNRVPKRPRPTSI